jgi:CheY-like chemotaxis protein
LDDLLTIAPGEAGQLSIVPEPFEPAELIHDVADKFRSAAEVKGLEIEISSPSDAVTVVSDPSRITQILTNLVSNAVKYTAHGRVCIGVEFDFEHEGRVDFTVVDTGPGIPDSFLATMYEPFSRLPTSLHQPGSGMGLAVVRTLVERLGGEISVETALGIGTEFRVYVPARRYIESSAARYGLRILIVDDRPDVLGQLSEVSEDLGYDADMAASPAEALALCSQEEYTAILIDLDLPLISGEQLAQMLRTVEGRNLATRLIAMSASPRVRQIGSIAPFDGFLMKPFGALALRYAVESDAAGAIPSI